MQIVLKRTESDMENAGEETEVERECGILARSTAKRAERNIQQIFHKET